MIKIPQHFHRIRFVRAVTNINANPFRVRARLAIDQRRDQSAQTRQDPIERFGKTDSLPPRPGEPRRFMPLPFRRHPVTQLGRSPFAHPATVEAAVSAAQQSISAADTAASTPLGSATRLSKRRSSTGGDALPGRPRHAEACPSVALCPLCPSCEIFCLVLANLS